MKISVITPSYNSAETLKRAIESVLAQGYDNFEHIIVDGGSTDGTQEVLRSYKHLRWLSEPDRGQVEAMNKGFALAEGKVIGYLNADDYYCAGTFSAVQPYFKQGWSMIMGQVLVYTQGQRNMRKWLCDPAVEFESMLRHWEDNAFCVNPVGYFYRREVQERHPLREETGAKHDLEFLLEVAAQNKIKKVERVFGVFNHALDTQTAREQLEPGYWRPENFPFIERFLEQLPPGDQENYRLERFRGYQLRRQRTAREGLLGGRAEELFRRGEVFLLPEDEDECAASECGFVEHDRIGTKSDWIIPVFISGKVASKSICYVLKNLPDRLLNAQVYHVHQMNRQTIKRSIPTFLPIRSHACVGLALKDLYDHRGEQLQWKFIAGVREPISGALSGVFENWPHIEEKDILAKMDILINYRINHFFVQYRDAVGLNVFDYEFDYQKKYSIIEKENLSLLVYRMEELPRTFPQAMEEYLGLKGLELPSVNVGEKKSYAEKYKQVKEKMCFDRAYLEEVYKSKFVRHFYTEEEISAFIEKWSTPRSNKAGRFTPVEILKKLPQKDYYIFFVPRSGSTLLTELLQKTGVLGNPQEWLNKDYFHLVEEKYGYDTSHLEQYLQTVREKQRTENQVFGIEIAPHQLSFLEQPDHFWSYFSKEGKFIFLRREKIIEQAISLYKSKKTNIWLVRGKLTDIPEVEYDSACLADALRVVVREEINIIEFLRENKLDPLIISYEELIANKLDVTKKIANFVDVDWPDKFQLPEVSLLKMGKKEEVQSFKRRFINDATPVIRAELHRLEEVYRRWGRYITSRNDEQDPGIRLRLEVDNDES